MPSLICLFMFSLLFLFIYFVLGGEKHKMGAKRLLYPFFLTELGNVDLMELNIGGQSVKF